MLNGFNGVKVFSATMVAERQVLGEKVTDWIRANPQYQIVDTIITQSSDERFHCITITVFYNESTPKKEVASGSGTGRSRQVASSAQKS